MAAEEYAKDAVASERQKTSQIYPPPTDLVSGFWRDKYEKDAKKYWDIFYKRNSDKFFKDRHYLQKEWGAYFQKVAASDIGRFSENGGDSNETHVILEIGCGVGNTLFPLLETYPNLFVHACDFSPRAVNLVKAHKEYTEKRIHAFVCDVTSEDLTLHIPVKSVDVATLVFCLSAISPEKMPQVLQNIKRVLKPNGHVLIRDYASGDLAQERLSNKVQKISQNFYVRGDGTRAYYFTEPGLIDLFKAEGYSCVTVKIYEKTVENRAREITMDRRWIQGVFSLENDLNVEDNKLRFSRLSVGSEDIDLSEGVALNMFGAPGLEVMPVAIDRHVFQIKSLSKDYQHSCKATGLMLWESARVLATLLARNSSTLAFKTVLELGCGSGGICSMVAAMAAGLVVATDGDPDTVALLSDNLQANSQQFASNNICIETLNWGSTEQIQEVKQRTSGQGFDMIIGSDVMYVAEALPLLFATAKALIAEAKPGKPEPSLLLCHIERHVNEASIVDAAKECGFSLEAKWPIDKTETHQSFTSAITSIFPCGLEEAFTSHAVVQLFCFRQILKQKS
eukprot:c9855_g1_i1 orf=108-1802(+)